MMNQFQIIETKYNTYLVQHSNHWDELWGFSIVVRKLEKESK